MTYLSAYNDNRCFAFTFREDRLSIEPLPRDPDYYQGMLEAEITTHVPQAADQGCALENTRAPFFGGRHVSWTFVGDLDLDGRKMLVTFGDPLCTGDWCEGYDFDLEPAVLELGGARLSFNATFGDGATRRMSFHSSSEGVRQTDAVRRGMDRYLGHFQDGDCEAIYGELSSGAKAWSGTRAQHQETCQAFWQAVERDVGVSRREPIDRVFALFGEGGPYGVAVNSLEGEDGSTGFEWVLSVEEDGVWKILSHHVR